MTVLASTKGWHQTRPPQRTAAAPAKSPACAKAAIITTSPVVDLTAGYGAIEVDRDAGAEQVAALIETYRE